MSIHINQVLDYLDAHPVCRQADSMESLLEMLYDIYLSHNSGNSEKIRALFDCLWQQMEGLTEQARDGLFCAVGELCAEHEVLAFSQGVLVGMLLMTEVNRIP